MMMYKVYSGLLLCSDASSMLEMVWELRSRASLTSRNQFCTLASSYHEVQACEMRVYEVHTHEVHACEVHAHEVYAHEVHAHEVHAREVHAREMHTHEVHACEM